MFNEGYLKVGKKIFPYWYGVFDFDRVNKACVLVRDPWTPIPMDMEPYAFRIAKTTFKDYLNLSVPFEKVIWFETDWYQSVADWHAKKLDDVALRQRYTCEVPEGARTIREVSFRFERKGFLWVRQKLVVEWEPYHWSPEKLEAIMTELELVIGDVRKSIKV